MTNDEFSRLEDMIPQIIKAVRSAHEEELWTGNLETDRQYFHGLYLAETDPITKNLYLRVFESYTFQP